MIKSNIANIKERIKEACSGVNRDPALIKIIAISKGRSVEQIKEAIDAGITDIGENRVQEALLKYNSILNTQYSIRTKWHMVGHLQTNKVKDAVRIFDLIQSVDSLRLASEIDKQAAKANKVQDILLEVNASGEANKFGLKPENAIQAVKEISGFKNINIKGLMTMAPVVNNPEESRIYFKRLKELFDDINAIRATQYPLQILSMGMTGDFQQAIKEGSSMIRLGRAIFGD